LKLEDWIIGLEHIMGMPTILDLPRETLELIDAHLPNGFISIIPTIWQRARRPVCDWFVGGGPNGCMKDHLYRGLRFDTDRTSLLPTNFSGIKGCVRRIQPL
jgi:hypothetical protein